MHNANVFVEASISSLIPRFTYGTQNYRQSDWSFFFSQPCSEDVFIFPRDKLTVLLFLFQSF